MVITFAWSHFVESVFSRVSYCQKLIAVSTYYKEMIFDYIW